MATRLKFDYLQYLVQGFTSLAYAAPWSINLLYLVNMVTVLIWAIYWPVGNHIYKVPISSNSMEGTIPVRNG